MIKKINLKLFKIWFTKNLELLYMYNFLKLNIVLIKYLLQILCWQLIFLINVIHFNYRKVFKSGL